MASTDQATSGGGEKHVHFQESCSVYFYPPTQHDYSDGDTTTEDLSPLIDHAVGKPEEECDINTFNLLPWQKQLVYQTLMTPSLLNPNLLSMAKVTHLEITPYLVYRYYSSQNWDIRKKYAGQDFHIAIMTTIHWRLNFNSVHGNHSFRGIHAIQTSQFASLVRHGLGYTGGLDQHGRVIMYAKVNRVGLQAMPHHVYLSLLMYTVERADRMCAERHKGANGEFVVVLDLTGFSIARRGLPVSVLQEFFTHTAHYPFRLSGIYLLNNNSGFSALWGMMKVLLPKRLEKLTYMPNTKAKADKLMCEHLGRNHVEQCYGGTLPEGPGDLYRYFAQGYWEKQAAAAATAAAAAAAAHRSINIPPPPPPPPLSPPTRSSLSPPSVRSLSTTTETHKHTSHVSISPYKGSGATV